MEVDRVSQSDANKYTFISKSNFVEKKQTRYLKLFKEFENQFSNSHWITFSSDPYYILRQRMRKI